MILSGDLKDFSLADVLQLLLQQRKSGVLTLVNGREKAELFISQGNITGARVNGATPETKVKEMLVESGRVGRKEMSELEAISADMDKPLLGTLTAKGFLGEEDKEEWIQIISEDMVCELFSWQHGTYEFGTGLKGQSAGPSHMNISTEFACMEGMRRIDEWPKLRESLPNEKAAFLKSGKAFEGDQMGWDRLVLELVDGKRSVLQIGKEVPFGSFRLHECMVNLWHGGYITPVEDSGQEVDAAVEADPEAEKDRKTAMVLGVAVLFIIMASAVRLVALWIMGAGGPNLAGYEDRISQALARDNLETFLIEHAARRDAYPKTLGQLVKEGIFKPGEVKGGQGARPVYKVINDRDFFLK